MASLDDHCHPLWMSAITFHYASAKILLHRWKTDDNPSATNFSDIFTI
jgi:hypothetical protein